MSFDCQIKETCSEVISRDESGNKTSDLAFRKPFQSNLNLLEV